MLSREYLDKLDPDLAKMLERYGDSLSSRFKCHRVGKITKFDSERMVVSVRLLDKMLFRDTVQDFTELTDLPLVVYGNAKSRLTLGDVTGSECVVHFNDTDIDLWFATGEAYEPNTARQHDWSDGFVELRPYSLPNVTPYPLTETVLERGNCKLRLLDDGSVIVTNGQAVLTMTEGNITITGNVSVTGDLTVSGTITGNTDVIAGGISGKSHVHSGVTAGTATTGAPQ